MIAKLKYIVLSILLILATYNISKTTLEIYKSSKRLDDLRSEAEAKKKENDELKKELSFRQTPEFIEKEARNKLNLVKPGEKVLIPTAGTVDKAASSNFDDGLQAPLVARKDLTNPQKWFKLFFDNN